VSYAFSHELIRQTLIAGLSLPRRQRRHLKVATAMERVLGERVATRAADLAYHLYQAGAAADADKTVHFLILAAEQAIDSAAYTEALAHCERAATIEEVGDRHLLARLAYVRANALLGNARWIDAVQAYHTALEAAITAGDTELTAKAGLLASWYNGWMGEFEVGERTARRAFENSHGADPATRARLMGQIAGHGAIARLDGSDYERQMAEAVAIGPAIEDVPVSAIGFSAGPARPANPSVAPMSGLPSVIAYEFGNVLIAVTNAVRPSILTATSRRYSGSESGETLRPTGIDAASLATSADST